MADTTEILKQQSKDFQNAKQSRIPRWQPEDGNYVDAITEIRVVPWGRNNDDARVVIMGEILDGPYANKQHNIGSFGSSNFSMLIDTVETLGGDVSQMTNAADAVEFLKGKVGETVNVNVETSKAKNGNVYTNAKITGIVETS